MEKSTIKERFAVLKRLVFRQKRMLQIGFVIFLMGAIAGLFELILCTNRKVSNDAITRLKERDSILERAVFDIKVPNQPSQALKKLGGKTKPKEKVEQDKPISQSYRLREQYTIIAKMKENYLTSAQNFYVYHYAFDLFFTVLSVLSAFLGFLVLKKGWEGTKSYYLKSAFMVVAFYTSLFGVLPKAMNNKENIKNNLDKYNYFSGLQLDIYDLISDNQGFMTRKTPAALDSLNVRISLINKSIKENQSLYFDTKMEEVPTTIKILDK